MKPITLTQQEIELLKSIIHRAENSQPDLFLNGNPVDPLHGLRKSTRKWFAELKATFGNEVINRKDKRLVAINHKYYIQSFGSYLRTFEKNGLCEVTRTESKNGHGSQRIELFMFK